MTAKKGSSGKKILSGSSTAHYRIGKREEKYNFPALKKNDYPNEEDLKLIGVVDESLSKLSDAVTKVDNALIYLAFPHLTEDTFRKKLETIRTDLDGLFKKLSKKYQQELIYFKEVEKRPEVLNPFGIFISERKVEVDYNKLGISKEEWMKFKPYIEDIGSEFEARYGWDLSKENTERIIEIVRQLDREGKFANLYNPTERSQIVFDLAEELLAEELLPKSEVEKKTSNLETLKNWILKSFRSEISKEVSPYFMANIESILKSYKDGIEKGEYRGILIDEEAIGNENEFFYRIVRENDNLQNEWTEFFSDPEEEGKDLLYWNFNEGKAYRVSGISFRPFENWETETWKNMKTGKEI